MSEDRLLLARAVVALERIAGALAGDHIYTIIPDETLVADIDAGLSLRQCAVKHGVGVGRVRGAITRTQKGKEE